MSDDQDNTKFPTTPEATVLPADDDRPKIGWTVHEYLGPRIGKTFDAEGRLVPLTQRDDLRAGDTFYAPSLFGGGHHELVVALHDDGKPYGRNDALLATLEFDVDDRHCWTTAGLINAKAIRKLVLDR